MLGYKQLLQKQKKQKTLTIRLITDHAVFDGKSVATPGYKIYIADYQEKQCTLILYQLVGAADAPPNKRAASSARNMSTENA